MSKKVVKKAGKQKSKTTVDSAAVRKSRKVLEKKKKLLEKDPSKAHVTIFEQHSFKRKGNNTSKRTRSKNDDSDDEITASKHSSRNKRYEEDEFSDDDDDGDIFFSDMLDNPVSDIDDDSDSEQQAKTKKAKAKKFEEIEELHRENEFGVSSAKAGEDEQVTLNDLIGSFKKDTSDAAGEMLSDEWKKKLQKLDEKSKQVKYVEGAEAAKIARKTAYEAVSSNLERWQPLQNQLSKEKLVFPLPSSTQPSLKVKAKALHATVKATPLESSIHEILDQCGLTNKAQYEDFIEATPNKELSIKRAQELAKLRSQMFYQQQKLKRVAKIKSKVYRKIAKKEKEKKREEAERQLALADPEFAKQLAEKREIKRAQERVRMKQKNTRDWVRSVLSAPGRTDETRASVADAMRQNEALRRLMMERDSDEESEAENDQADLIAAADDEADNALESMKADLEQEPEQKGLFGLKFMQKASEKKKQHAKEMIEQMQRDLATMEQDSDDDEEKKHASVGRRKVAPSLIPKQKAGTAAVAEEPDDTADNLVDNSHQLDKVAFSAGRVIKASQPITVGKESDAKAAAAIKRIFEPASFSDDDEDDSAKQKQQNDKGNVVIEVSRKDSQKFMNKTPISFADNKQTEDNDEDSDSSSSSDDDLDNFVPQQKQQGTTRKIEQFITEEDDTDNPWLEGTDHIKHAANDQITKALKKSQSADEVNLKIDMENVIQINTNPYADNNNNNNNSGKKNKKENKEKNNSKSNIDKDSKSNNTKETNNKKRKHEDEKTESAEPADKATDSDQQTAKDNKKSNKKTKLTQEELLKRAFASDNFEEDFEKQRKELEEGSDDEDPASKIRGTDFQPGWGSWGGVGIDYDWAGADLQKKAAEEASKKEAKAKQSLVIVNRAYLSSGHAQFNQRLKEISGRAIGAEWNPLTQFERYIQPKIKVKAGAIVEPLSDSHIAMSKKQQAEKARQEKQQAELIAAMNKAKMSQHPQNKQQQNNNNNNNNKQSSNNNGNKNQANSSATTPKKGGK